MQTQDCSICYNPLAEEKDIISTSCAHTFHTSCLSAWVKIKPSCPMCRSTVISIGGVDANTSECKIEILEETEHDFVIKFVNSYLIIDKYDINFIAQETGKNILKIIHTYIQNNRDIVDTIMDLH